MRAQRTWYKAQITFKDKESMEPNPEVDDSDKEEKVEMMVISDKEALNSIV
nr:11592_t:CDS:2 [Entrophospora candida]